MIATPSFHKFQVERIMKNADIIGLMKPLGKLVQNVVSILALNYHNSIQSYFLQTVGLLGRMKSLRPDLVPQAIPYQSNAVSFPKAPATIRNGLYDLAEHMRQQHESPNQFTFTIESEEQRVTYLT